MSIHSRIDRLTQAVFARGTSGKYVVIRSEDGPAVQWNSPTNLTLRVPEGYEDNPDAFLTDEQRALIEPQDTAIVMSWARIQLPGSDPGRLVSHTLGAPRIELPRRRDESDCRSSEAN